MNVSLRFPRKSLWLVGVGAALLIAVPAMASQDILALVQGISGSAGGGQIRVKSFSIGYAAPVDANGNPGAVTMAPVTITKIFDETSPLLMEAGGSGQMFDTLKLTGTSAPGAVETVTLNKARITDWRLVDVADPTSTSTQNRGIEQITFVAGSMTITHQKMGADLKLQGNPVSGSVGK